MNAFRLAAAAALLLAAAPAVAADSCVDCHRTATLPLDREHDYAQWEQSVHAKAGVGCVACHGGDATKSGADAHKGVLSSADPASPIWFTKIPETCGKCHADEYKAFKLSAHHAELQRSGKGPNCVTCHGSMANEVLGPRQTDTTCALCHRKPTGVRPTLMAVNNASDTVARFAAAAKRSGDPKALATAAALAEKRRALLQDWHTFNLPAALNKAQALAKEAVAAASANK